MIQYITHHALDDAVVTACELLCERNDLRSIALTTSSDMTYTDMIRFRDLAREHGLALTICGVRGITLRSRWPRIISSPRTSGRPAGAGPGHS